MNLKDRLHYSYPLLTRMGIPPSKGRDSKFYLNGTRLSIVTPSPLEGEGRGEGYLGRSPLCATTGPPTPNSIIDGSPTREEGIRSLLN